MSAPRACGPVARETLEDLLQSSVDGELEDSLLRRAADRLICGMRRKKRHWLAALRHLLLLRPRDFFIAERAVPRDPVEHAVARSLRGLREAVGPAGFRRLRQRDQERGLAEREPARLFAEISERGRPRPFEIAAIGRERKVEREDLVLAQRRLELNRAQGLPDLGLERSLAPWLEQPRDLHGEGRAARNDVPLAHELVSGAAERERIEAAMRRKALVLIGEERLEIARIDVGPGRGEPPASFAREIGPEQRAVAVENDARDFEIASERRRSVGCKQAGHRARSGGGEPERANRRGKGNAPQSSSMVAAPLILPERPRRRRSRSGRSGLAGTCPRPRLAAARSFPATRRGRHRRRCRWWHRPCAARRPR